MHVYPIPTLIKYFRGWYVGPITRIYISDYICTYEINHNYSQNILNHSSPYHPRFEDIHFHINLLIATRFQIHRSNPFSAEHVHSFKRCIIQYTSQDFHFHISLVISQNFKFVARIHSAQKTYTPSKGVSNIHP